MSGKANRAPRLVPARGGVPKKPTKQLLRTAYHEAGHAVAAYTLRLPMQETSLVENEDSLGRMALAPPPASFQPETWYGEDRRMERRIEAHIICALAGPAAEAHWAGRRSHAGAHDDYQKAMYLAGWAVSDSSGEGVRRYVAWLQYRAEALVQGARHWPVIEALAAQLLARRRLGTRQTRAVITEAITAHRGVRVTRDAAGRIRFEAVEAAGAAPTT